jgi:hypothetical protein
MSRYWRHQSYGNLSVEYDVYPKVENGAYRLGDTGDYGPWTLGAASYEEAQRFFREAVMAADQADSIPFGAFDAVVVFTRAPISRRTSSATASATSRPSRSGSSTPCP